MNFLCSSTACNKKNWNSTSILFPTFAGTRCTKLPRSLQRLALSCPFWGGRRQPVVVPKNLHTWECAFHCQDTAESSAKPAPAQQLQDWLCAEMQRAASHKRPLASLSDKGKMYVKYLDIWGKGKRWELIQTVDGLFFIESCGQNCFHLLWERIHHFFQSTTQNLPLVMF